MGRPELEESWQAEAIELMVRTGCSLKQAAVQLDLNLTSQEADIILRRKSFNKRLNEERNRYFATLGADPNFRKETIIGKLLDLANKLEYEGKHDKAADSLFKAAKIAGFVGPDTEVSVIGELSSRELEQLRAKLGGDKKDESRSIN